MRSFVSLLLLCVGFTAAAQAVADSEETPGFLLSSPSVTEDGLLPIDCTADGTSSTLDLSWSGVPDGTRSFAVTMHHVDPEGIIKEYWNLYDLPPEVSSLPRNAKDIGRLGVNTINHLATYAPPMSKGPGRKVYVFTVYALSKTLAPILGDGLVTRARLLEAMKGAVLASAELQTAYSRPGNSGPGPGDGPRPEPPPDPPPVL